MLNERTTEATVLAGMFARPNDAIEISGQLTPDAFTDSIYRTIFEAAQIVLMAGKELNEISAMNAIQACKSPVGLRKLAISELSSFEVSVSYSKLQAATSRLLALYEARKVEKALGEVLNTLKDSPEKAKSAFINSAISISNEAKESGSRHISDSIDETIEELQLAMEAHRTGQLPPSAVATGFPFMDKRLGGLRKGNMVTIGAATGGGKSTISRQMILNMAGNGHPVFYAFLEMLRAEVTALFACTVSGTNSNDIFTGAIQQDPRQLDRYLSGLHSLKSLPITFQQGRSVRSIIGNYKRWVLSLPKGHKTPVFVFDYVGIASNYIQGANKEQTIADTAHRLHACATEDESLVIALTQLNRDYLKRSDKRPQLGDSRDSAAVEHDSAYVIYLHDPKVHSETDEAGNRWDDEYMEAIVVKSRFGGRGIYGIYGQMGTGQMSQSKSLSHAGSSMIRYQDAINGKGGSYAF